MVKGNLVYSVSERQEGGDTSSDPVVLVFVRRQVNVHHEVGRVAGGGEGSGSTEDLVNWAHVEAVCFSIDTAGRLRWLPFRLEPNQRQLDVELLWLGLVQLVSSAVPSGSFEEETVTEDTVVWSLLQLRWLNFIVHLEVEGQLIDGEHVLSGVVLSSTGEESLREEESGQPEGGRHAVIVPLGNEDHPFVDVGDPGAKRLQGKRSDGAECLWHLVVEEGSGHSVQFLRHDDLTEQGLLHICQHDDHSREETVVSDDFLREDGVHGLVVTGRVLLDHVVVVEGSRSLVLDLLRDIGNDFFSRLTSAGARSRLDTQDELEQVSRGGLISGDLSVVMETEGFWIWHQRQIGDVLLVVVNASNSDGSVDTRVRELEVLVKQFWFDEPLDNGTDQSDVLVIGDSTAIVDLGSQELQHLVGNDIVLIEEVLELLGANHEILIGELVHDVPADRSELASILNTSVEEGEGKSQLLVLVWLCAVIQRLLIVVGVGSHQVRSETGRRLESHLNRTLQDTDREGGCGSGSEPDSEVLVVLIV